MPSTIACESFSRATQMIVSAAIEQALSKALAAD
jgi:hypothetical protein